jgi:hypothetical protein
VRSPTDEPSWHRVNTNTLFFALVAPQAPNGRLRRNLR